MLELGRGTLVLVETSDSESLRAVIARDLQMPILQLDLHCQALVAHPMLVPVKVRGRKARSRILFQSLVRVLCHVLLRLVNA